MCNQSWKLDASFCDNILLRNEIKTESEVLRKEYYATFEMKLRDELLPQEYSV
jgi:hypothetical protein